MKKPNIKILNVPQGDGVYKFLAKELPKYREKDTCSELLIVEGTKENPRIGIRYPGNKLKKRELKVPRKNSALWANLLDFLVVPFINGIELSPKDFNYRNILLDFDTHKKDSDVFWNMIVELYESGVISKESPRLPGIEPKLFLEMLKWMMIQEDLNYRLSYDDAGCDIKYTLETKGGSSTSNGAGRAKFFAALLLVRDKHFTANIVSKIIP